MRTCAMSKAFCMRSHVSAVLPIPKHPRIRHLGFVPDDDKFDALAAADALIMPSPYESLSIVALEAWALGKPVLANNAVSLWAGLRLLKRGDSIPGYGRLLRDHLSDA